MKRNSRFTKSLGWSQASEFCCYHQTLMVSACVLNCLNKDSLVSSCFLGCAIVCFATVIVSLLVKLYTCTRLPLSNSVDRYLQCNKYNKGKRCLFFNFYSSLWWACCPSLPGKHARPIAQKLTVKETCFSAFFSEVFSNLQKLCKNGPLCIFLSSSSFFQVLVLILYLLCKNHLEMFKSTHWDSFNSVV